MNQLKVVSLDGQLVTESRDVAEMVAKEHKNLLRDIKGYEQILLGSTLSAAKAGEFFIQSSYKDSTGRELPCYLLTKKVATW